MVNFLFQTFKYYVVSEYSRLDHSELVLGPFENLTNLVLDPLLPLGPVGLGQLFGIRRFGIAFLARGANFD
jgi:hypothetical protein